MSEPERALMWKWRMNAALFTVIAVANVLIETRVGVAFSVVLGVGIAFSIWAQANTRGLLR